MRFVFHVRAIVFIAISTLLMASRVHATEADQFQAAQQRFADLSLDERLRLQVDLIAAGYLNSVPTERLGKRVYDSIRRFQSEHGYYATGFVEPDEQAKLAAVAAPLLQMWGFRRVEHPTRKVSIWMPIGLGLNQSRDKYGSVFQDTNHKFMATFSSIQNSGIKDTFQTFIADLRKDSNIGYQTLRNDWFVIVANTNGIDRYIRFHEDGGNLTGFSLYWNNENGNVSAERIAVLMSASLWADRTGAPFINPPAFSSTAELRSQPSETRPTRVDPAPPAPAPKPVQPHLFSGTGFFVAADGSFITNAHVVEDCSAITIKSDDGAVETARVIAKDATNDLALLKRISPHPKFASLRIGARLGESVAAFGFPHTDMLSTSGNFTLGNITALTGMRDDVRFIQVSAPVQSGNSGGPLLDQSGNLVGVVTAKLNALRVAANGGDLPQNVNFAVKSAILTTFLDANRVSYATSASDPHPLAPADLADEAKAMSGFVLCR